MQSSTSKDFDPVALRALVEQGKKSGLIRAPGTRTTIEKNGIPVAAETGLRSLWMDVDPAKATHWLENNFRNRPISHEVVKSYARDMTNGVWVSTHQGVAFNDRDELIDGQHRLHAIVNSGKTIRMMVTFGLPSVIEGSEMTTMDAVDRGRTRSVADQLKIQHGMKNGSIIAAVCSSIGGLCYGERTRRLSVGQTLDIHRAFEPAIAFVIEHRATTHGLKAAGVLAAFAFAIAATEDTVLPDLRPTYIALLEGDALERGSPLQQLRDFLTSDEAKLLTRGTDRGVAELVLQALHLEIKGDKVAKLSLGSDGGIFFSALQTERVAKIAAMFRLPEGSKK